MKHKVFRPKEAVVSDLTDLLKHYSSGWVALSSDEKAVVAAAETLDETREQAAQRGYPHPIFVKILPQDRGYIYGRPYMAQSPALR
jgi:hypothetical protein